MAESVGNIKLSFVIDSICLLVFLCPQPLSASMINTGSCRINRQAQIDLPLACPEKTINFAWKPTITS